VDERLNRVRAAVTAAAALDPATEQQLRQRLRERLGKEVVLEVRQDPALVGGIVTQVGSVVYDGSLRTQLVKLREELAQG
jgi:F-type H+-transporting ATPase subunit delta